MTVIQAIFHIWHKDERFVPGEIITNIDDRSAQQLVTDGAAFFVNEPLHQPIKETDELPPVKSKEEEEDYKALDEDYSYEELKEQAGIIGLTFKGNISKADLIHLIINQGKTDEFFEDEV